MTPEELKKARATLKCTAKELALALGEQPSTIAAWERGDEFPTKRSVDAIAALLEKGGDAIPKKSKGGDPFDALRDPDLWELVRKLVAHPKLRAECGKLAEKYDEP